MKYGEVVESQHRVPVKFVVRIYIYITFWYHDVVL